MHKPQIELLRQQAQAYLMWAKCVKDEEAKKRLLTLGMNCAKMAVYLKQEDDKDMTGTFEYKLAA